MKSSFSFRPAQLDEIVKIADFQFACWQAAYVDILSDSFLSGMSRDHRREQWRYRLLSGERKIMAAWADDDVAGVVSWTDGDLASGCELKTLYIGADYQRSGLGSELLHQAVRDEPARLWVFEANIGAQIFYERHGFAATGDSNFDAETRAKELLFAR